MFHIHHNPQPLPATKAHEAVAAPARQSEVARKLVVTREQFAAVARLEQVRSAEQMVEACGRPDAQATASAPKRPWLSPGGYLPAAACDSFRVH